MPDAPKPNRTDSDAVPGVVLYSGRAKTWLWHTLRVALVGCLAGGLLGVVFAWRGDSSLETVALGAYVGTLFLGAIPALVCAWWTFLYAVAEVARAIRSP